MQEAVVDDKTRVLTFKLGSNGTVSAIAPHFWDTLGMMQRSI